MRVFNQNKVRQQQWFWLHLGIEVISAIVFALLMLVYGVDSQGIVIGGVYIYFMIIAVIDVKYRLVLNVMMYPAMLFVLFVPIAQPQPSTLELSLGGILVFCIFGLTAWLKPGQIGGGDIKLAILIGFMFGFPQVLWALLVGGGTGAVVAIAMLSTGRYGRKSTIPYAPFLCLGAMIALIYNPILF